MTDERGEELTDSDAVSLPQVRALYWNLLLERARAFGEVDERRMAEWAIIRANDELARKLMFRQHASEQLNPGNEKEAVVRVRVEWAGSHSQRTHMGGETFDLFSAELESRNAPKVISRRYGESINEAPDSPRFLNIRAEAGAASRRSPSLNIWIGDPEHDTWLLFESLSAEQMYGLRDESDEDPRTYFPFLLERPAGEIAELEIHSGLLPVITKTSARLIPLGPGGGPGAGND